MKNVQCEHCKYEWISRSGLIYVTCPNCGKKTKIKDINLGEENGTGGSVTGY